MNKSSDSPCAFIRPRTLRRPGLPAVFAAAALSAAAAGCVSVPIATGPERFVGVREENAVTGTPEYAVRAVVERSGDDAIVRFSVRGDFTNHVKRVSTYERDASTMLSAGLFPGVPGDRPELALAAIWYNVLMLGTPTLSGLFAEPFLQPAGPASDVGAGRGLFRRSALVGMFRWTDPGRGTKLVERESSETARTEKVVLPVGDGPDDISLSWTGLSPEIPEPEFGKDAEGAYVRFRGVNLYPRDRFPEPVSVRLHVPSGHSLKAALRDDEYEPVPVELQ